MVSCLNLWPRGTKGRSQLTGVRRVLERAQPRLLRLLEDGQPVASLSAAARQEGQSEHDERREEKEVRYLSWRSVAHSRVRVGTQCLLVAPEAGGRPAEAALEPLVAGQDPPLPRDVRWELDMIVVCPEKEMGG